MNIIRERDLELFNQHIGEIQEKVKEMTWDLIEPRGDLKMEIVNKLIDFVKKKKRKIYGSYAQNKIIGLKNKKDEFLGKLDVPDIDFYSPDPLTDLFEICNMFYEMGYKDVVGREAQHEETYKIFVDEVETCDISYVPRNIYNKIPFIEIDGAVYTHPNFLFIDLFRVFTDPLTSWEQKLDKRFKRFYLLQKYYPFAKLEKNLDINFNENREEFINICYKILQFATNNKSIIISGIYAFNYFLQESGNKQFKQTDINYFELYSGNYQKDTLELINLLTNFYQDKLSYIEHYPFFQFTDFSTRIYYKKKLICIIYGNNHKCLPYNEVKAIHFEKNKSKPLEGKINLASFNLLLLNLLISYTYYRTNDDSKHKDICMSLISQAIQCRNFYLDKNKKNIFNGGIFNDFIVDCIGATITAKKLYSDRIKENLEKKRPAIFQYRPSEHIQKNSHDFHFKNSSGNPINNEKNLKLRNYGHDINVNNADKLNTSLIYTNIDTDSSNYLII